MLLVTIVKSSKEQDSAGNACFPVRPRQLLKESRKAKAEKKTSKGRLGHREPISQKVLRCSCRLFFFMTILLRKQIATA